MPLTDDTKPLVCLEYDQTCDRKKLVQVVRQVSGKDLKVEDVKLETKKRTVKFIHDPGGCNIKA